MRSIPSVALRIFIGLLGTLAAACTPLPPLEPDPGDWESPPVAAQPARPSARRSTPEPPVAKQRSAIMVCGNRLSVDAPVVLWNEAPRYDAHSRTPRFGSGPQDKLRYRPDRKATDQGLAARVRREGWSPETLASQVDQLVLHYDACGTSKRCFEVLHDQRGLSSHFLLDVDGTIYQTLDLSHTAWHAKQANPRSIGIEIAHIGAFSTDESAKAFAKHYDRDATGRVRYRLPSDAGLRRPGFVAHPARPAPVTGRIHGDALAQYDFTEEQYASLEALTAALVEVFPRIRLDIPRDAAGRVRTTVLSDSEFGAFRGILGHYHVGSHKIDPGPAFDWEGFLSRVRSLVANP